MRPEFTDMEPSQTAAGSPGREFDIGRFREKTLQVSDIDGGTLQIEGSDDGTNFEQVGSDITTNGFVQIPETFSIIRIVTTVDTGGSAVVILGGLDSRTD